MARGPNCKVDAPMGKISSYNCIRITASDLCHFEKMTRTSTGNILQYINVVPPATQCYLLLVSVMLLHFYWRFSFKRSVPIMHSIWSVFNVSTISRDVSWHNGSLGVTVLALMTGILLFHQPHKIRSVIGFECLSNLMCKKTFVFLLDPYKETSVLPDQTFRIFTYF